MAGSMHRSASILRRSCAYRLGCVSDNVVAREARIAASTQSDSSREGGIT